MVLSCILVPGSGEPNFDTFVDNPMETTKQKSEEVHALLEKLSPDTIMLNPILIAIVRAAKKKKKKINKEIEEEMEAVEATRNMARKKTKGRSKPSKRAKKRKVFSETRGPSWSKPRRSTGDLTRNNG